MSERTARTRDDPPGGSGQRRAGSPRDLRARRGRRHGRGAARRPEDGGHRGLHERRRPCLPRGHRADAGRRVPRGGLAADNGQRLGCGDPTLGGPRRERLQPAARLLADLAPLQQLRDQRRPRPGHDDHDAAADVGRGTELGPPRARTRVPPGEVRIVASRPELLSPMLSRAVSAFGRPQRISRSIRSPTRSCSPTRSRPARRPSSRRASRASRCRDGDGGIDLRIGPLTEAGAAELREGLGAARDRRIDRVDRRRVRTEKLDGGEYVVYRMAGFG